jgi:hypothetical protein
MLVQRKKFLLFTTVPYTNSTGQFSYGYENINIGTSNGIASGVWDALLANAALNFEEYRVRRVVVKAQPGLGYTNDDRIKSSIFSRVDVNDQTTAATINNLNSLISAESTVNRTFTERSNIIWLIMHQFALPLDPHPGPYCTPKTNGMILLTGATNYGVAVQSHQSSQTPP